MTYYALLIAGDDETKAKKFQRGLGPIIHMWMTTARLRTFDEIFEMARLVKQDCDKLSKSSDKGMKCLSPREPRREEYPNTTGITKIHR